MTLQIVRFTTTQAQVPTVVTALADTVAAVDAAAPDGVRYAATRLPLDAATAAASAGPRHAELSRAALRDYGLSADDETHAVRLLERHLPWALERESHARRFDFFLAARFVLERLEAAGKAAVRLQLPQGFAPSRAGGRCDVAELAAWFDADLQGLADPFPFHPTAIGSLRMAASVTPLLDPTVPLGR